MFDMLVEQSSRVSPLTSVSRAVSSPPGSHHHLSHTVQLSPQASHSSSDSSSPPRDRDHEIDNDSSTTTTSSSTPNVKIEEGSSGHLVEDKLADTPFSHIQRLQFAFEKNSVFANYLTNGERRVNSHELDDRKMLTKLPSALTSPPQSNPLHEDDIKSEASDGEEMDHCELDNEDEDGKNLIQTPSTSPPDSHVNNINNIFQCPLCSVSCTSRHQFNEHLVSHSQQHACPKCSFLTSDEDTLRSHLQQAHDLSDPEALTDDQVSVPKVNSQGKMKTFKCKQCDYRAVTKSDFWDHSKSHIRQEKMLTCPKCPFVTEYKHHLEYHLRNHFGSKPFQCSKCSYSCVNKSMLNSHLKSHSNVYQYGCADCSYATKYCHSLKLHLRKYDHNPSMVLNLDGTPNPLPIIDVYGTRRGPKMKRPDPNQQPASEFASLSLNTSKGRNAQKNSSSQPQLIKPNCNNTNSTNSSGEDDPKSPTPFVTRDRDYNYDETTPPPHKDDRRHHNRQRKFIVRGSGSDNDNESDSEEESSPNTENFHHSYQGQGQMRRQMHQMPESPITPTSLGLLQATLMAHSNSSHSIQNNSTEQQQQQLQIAAAAAAAMAGKNPFDIYAALNQYILVSNPLLHMSPPPSFQDAPKKSKKSQSLTQILNQSLLSGGRNGQNQSQSASSPPLQNDGPQGQLGRSSSHMSSGGIPLDLRNPKNSLIPYETPTDSTEKRKRKGKAMRYDRKMHPLNLSENLKDHHDDEDEDPAIAMDSDGVLDFSNNNNNNCNNNNNNSSSNHLKKKTWARRHTNHSNAVVEPVKMNSPVMTLMCKHCEISFPDQVLYSMHMSYHSGDFDPFLCKSCGKKTADKTAFFLHLTTDSH